MNFLLLLPVLVTAAGLYMLIKLRFFFIVHPLEFLKKTLSSVRRKGNFSALTLALAGTLGVGNIFGVAVGIMIGGAGSLFWLFVSSFFSAAIKYSEVTLCISENEKDIGMIKVIERSFGKRGAFVAAVYASLCLLLALVMGAMLQARSVGGAMNESLGTDKYIVAAALLISVVAAVCGGVGKIQKATVYIIPLTTIIYIIMSFTVIFTNFSSFEKVLKQIFIEAFSIESMGGGILSCLMLKAVREGYVGGILSNEAGAGTSSLAHARGSGERAAESGLLGIFEVLFDTAFLCTLTGFVILLGVENPAEYTSAMRLISDAMANTLGDIAIPLLAFSVFFFAYSTVICWFYYGNVCREYLFGKRFKKCFFIVFAGFILLGIFTVDLVSIRAADTILLFMSLPTLFAVIKNSDRVVHLSENEKIIKKKIKASESEKEALHLSSQASPQNQPRSFRR